MWSIASYVDFLKCSGIMKQVTGVNLQSWSSLNMKVIPTMMDYYTIIIGPGTFNYSISYGFDSNPFPAICQYGNRA